MLELVNIGGQPITAAGMFGRDCAFPITEIRMRLMSDEVLERMPAYIGYWEDDTVAPVLLSNSIDIDTTVVTPGDACDVAEVSGTADDGLLTVPNMFLYKLATKPLDVTKLIPAFCRTRNIVGRPSDLLNSDGTINMGSPYAFDFARYAYRLVSRAMAELLSRMAMVGDSADPYGIDGLYTQLENGWDIVSASVPDYLNKAVVIDWQDLTGAAGPTTPDDLTVTGKTIDLWGTSWDVPVGLNLAQLMDEYIIPAIESNWTDGDGGVDMWEFHVRTGSARCLIETAACLQPCNSSDIIDTELRQRMIDMRAKRIVRFFPSEREFPMLESPMVEENTMWFGPRSIGGNNTYGIFMRDMDDLFRSIGFMGDTYGQQSGMPSTGEEPLLTPQRASLEFEARTMHADVEKISMNCVRYGLMAQMGVLAVERHLWVKVENVACASMINVVETGLTVDGASLETDLAAAVQTLPANASTGTDTTPDLTVSALAGADQYEFQVSGTNTFAALQATGIQAGATWTVTPALALGVHYWRARGINENGSGPWSGTRSFTIT
jgi:hypothetical protein